jgi:hypothetical protein
MFRTVPEAFKVVVSTKGLRGFYQGLSACIIRYNN